MLRPLAVAGLAAVAGPALAQTPVVLEDIVVTPDRVPTPADRTGASVAVATQPELRATGEAFLGEALARLPGVSVSQAGGPGQTSGFTLRGVPQGYVRVLVDGIEISDPSAPAGPVASLAGLTVTGTGRVEVLKGSQSALWGGQAVGGVVAISTPRPTRDGLEVVSEAEAGRYTTVSGSVGLLGRGARGEFGLIARGYSTDGFSAADRRAGNPEADGYSTTRLSFTGELYATDTLTLFGSGFWQDEDGDYDAGFDPATFLVADSLDRFEIETRGLRGGARFALGPVVSAVSAAWFDVSRTFFLPDGSRDFGAEGDRLAVDYLGEARLTPELDAQFGLDYRRDRARFDTDTGTSRPTSDITGAFAQLRYAPGALTLTAALRQDDHSAFGGETTWRVTAAYLLPTATVLRASAGTGFRPPSLDELYGPFGGNPDLRPETSLSYDAGIEQAFAGGRGVASATLFRIEIDDLISYDPTCPFPVPPGTRCYQQVTGGTAVSQGVELAGSFAVSDRLTLAAGYTYTDAEQPLPDGGSVRRPRVPRHDFLFGLEAVPVERTTLALSLQGVADTLDGAARLDDYALVNLRAGYAVTDEAELYLRAVNLLDQQYQTVRGYGTSDRALYVGLAARF